MLKAAVMGAGLMGRKLAEGRLGAKSSQGFLSWPSGAREQARERLAAHLNEQLRPAAKR